MTEKIFEDEAPLVVFAGPCVMESEDAVMAKILPESWQLIFAL